LGGWSGPVARDQRADDRDPRPSEAVSGIIVKAVRCSSVAAQRPIGEVRHSAHRSNGPKDGRRGFFQPFLLYSSRLRNKALKTASSSLSGRAGSDFVNRPRYWERNTARHNGENVMSTSTQTIIQSEIKARKQSRVFLLRGVVPAARGLPSWERLWRKENGLSAGTQVGTSTPARLRSTSTFSW